jgi:miniconductance mechanosensitive channel
MMRQMTIPADPSSTESAASAPMIGDNFISNTVQGGITWLNEIATSWGLNTLWSEITATAAAVIFVIVICIIANATAKAFIHLVAHRYLLRHPSAWTDSVVKQRVLLRLSHLVPVLLLLIAIPAFSIYGVDWWLRPVIELYVVWVLLLIAFGIIEVGEVIIHQAGLGGRIPATGISQALKILLSFIAIVLIFSILLSKSPLWFLSGLGAVAAVLMLIFKDAILGLVAGIQVSANDMVRVGDWITIPSKNVDGDVEEISLTTVRIRAFDQTVLLVPAYDLVTTPFTNWRAMSESGGRRIKRSIHIDISTIKFVEREDLERFKKFTVLAGELDRRIGNIDTWNSEHEIDTTERINGRRQTNIGLFRAYIEAYLRNHPKVHSEGFTFLIRHLDPGPTGLPVELYVFSNDNRWVEYEHIQADIFDHLLAAVPLFDLAVFQSPSGRDIASLREMQTQ